MRLKRFDSRHRMASLNKATQTTNREQTPRREPKLSAVEEAAKVRSRDKNSASKTNTKAVPMPQKFGRKGSVGSRVLVSGLPRIFSDIAFLSLAHKSHE
jgi:hypothetical protein